MRYESSGITGGIAEEELVGKSRYEEITHIAKSHFEYSTRGSALNLIRDMQPFDPTDPEPDFANAVHYYIFEKMGIDAEQLRFYTAVGSPLDKFHGVDGWFETGDGNNMKMVTIDVTLNPNKSDGYKADIIFLVPNGGLDRKVDKEQFIQYSEDLANQVVTKFLKR